MNSEKDQIEILKQRTEELMGKTVKDLLDNDKNSKYNFNNKGLIGQLVEKEWFNLQLNNFSRPDFYHLNIELKVTGLKKNKKNNFIFKERVKLAQIKFLEIINEKSFIESNLYKKIQKILFIYYLYDDNFKSRKFIGYKYFELKKDTIYFNQIEKDYYFIKNKIKNGEAHLLSEKDTVYLGATRNGSGKLEKKVKQPNSDYLAFKRAFSFKVSFLTEIKLNEDNNIQLKNTNQILKDIIKKYKGFSFNELIYKFNLVKYFTKKPKQIGYILFKEIIKRENLLSFFELNNFEAKTIRINKKEDNLKEDWKIGKNLFKNYENYKEKHSWEKTDYYDLMEKTYCVFITKEVNNDLYDSIIFDIQLISFNDIEYEAVKEIFFISYNFFLNGGFNKKLSVWSNRKYNNITHIRPSDINSKIKRKKTLFGEEVVNQNIWFNREVIFNKLDLNI